MNGFIDLLNNEIFISAFIAWFLAQIIKTVIHLIVHKEFVAERLVGSGGMPSSHSSTVCALATTTYYNYGAGSFEFAIALCFAIIVMHDARGVRRETGNQAVIINEMLDFFNKFSSDFTIEEKLKEFVGHTPAQVFAGAVLGIIVAAVMHFN